jgi:selenocysteine lyase/cysteine desulfurase
MDRRRFISASGVALGVSTVMPLTGRSLFINLKEGDWESVRSDFNLTREGIQMAQFLLASHPGSVRKAIDKHRIQLDLDPSEYWHNERRNEINKVLKAASSYLDCEPTELALTDSTTMSLAILYSGFKLRSTDHVLSTTHDHYSTEKSLEFAIKKNGASISNIALYDEANEASLDIILTRLKKGIRDNTRLVAVTYVHSMTGVKLPIKEMSKLIAEINQKRTEDNRIYFCVDGVHGFGVENITVKDLGCDFLATGTHKWLFGPRGTGILWAKKDAWHMVDPIIPPFSRAYGMWMGVVPKDDLSFFEKITPGGFHSFEHRWALNEAFDFHMKLGKEKIQNRTRELNTLMKEGMLANKKIKLHTPLSTDLSSGINAFEFKGIDPIPLVKKLRDFDIYGSTSPYKTIYARLTPCILNTEEEVRECLRVLESI